MNKFYTSQKLLDSMAVAQDFSEEWVYLQQIAPEFNLNFEIQGQRIMLQNAVGNPIFIDIDKKLQYHKKFFYKNSVYKQPLARALGIKKDKSPSKVLDATAGLLGDTLLIHSFGVQVEAMERNPLVSLLIVNALKNCESKIEIPFHFQSAMDLADAYPVIFFDPMYGGKNTKASPKKEMQVFRSFVGEDLDRISVAKHLRQYCDRLVIKRSVKASPLLKNPNMSFGSKSTCYDVYLSDGPMQC